MFGLNFGNSSTMIIENELSSLLDREVIINEVYISQDGSENHNSNVSKLYSKRNGALVFSFLCTGIGIKFLVTPVTYYLVGRHDLNSSIINTYRCCVYIPWCFKFLFGLISDCFPIFGSHRKLYFIFGWLIFIISNVILWIIENPSITQVCLFSFTQIIGLVFANTIADAMIVEITAFERKKAKGRMRIQVYFIREIGMVLGTLMSISLFNSDHWGWGLSINQGALIQALIPTMLILPLIPWMNEIEYRGEKVKSYSEMIQTCWEFIQIDAVWVPLTYLFLYNACFVQNPSWSKFLEYGLGYSEFQMGMLSFAGCLVAALGVLVYNGCFFDHYWKVLYGSLSAAGALFSLLQVFLCYGFTFGLPSFVFAIGDNSLEATVQLISFLPMSMMFLVMIPDGAEGCVYALITSWLDVASKMGFVFGLMLNCMIGDPTKDELRNEDYGKIEVITWLTSAIQLIPIWFLFCKYRNIDLIPNGRNEMRAQFDETKIFWWGAFICCMVYFGSISMSISESVLLIFRPYGCF